MFNSTSLKKLGYGVAGAFIVWAFTKTKLGGQVDQKLSNTLGG